MDQTTILPPSARRLSTALFLSFFTAQAAFVVLAPTLPQVAHDLGASVGGAGQLRTVAAVAGLIVAAGASATRLSARTMLNLGLALLASGGVASAAAPDMAVLAAAQILIGAGGASVLAGGLAAATSWPAAERRKDVLAWTVVGQPAAWVVAMPLVGLLAEVSWRWAWLVVPLAAAASLAALAGLGSAAQRTAGRRVWRDGTVRRWAFGELMAVAGWSGTLIYAGAMLSESYDLSAGTVALLLALAATTYFPGAFAARRRLDGELRGMLAALATALAAGVLVFALVRPSAVLSTALFAALVLLAGARSIAGGAFGLRAGPGEKVALGSIRSAATQLGYLLGASAGGVALDTGGYPLLGIVLALFFAAGALPHMSLRRQHDDLRLVRSRPEPLPDC